jgi:hypothetical protein
MDCTQPPRDIGRFRSKLTSLSHIKAVEWLNWVSMQAVPAVRALVYERAVPQLPGDQTRKRMVTGAHLRLFSLAQQLLDELCAYTTSEAAIERIDGKLRDLVHSCAATFPALGRRACTPNMHFALHLPAQMRDFGPVQGWWCFSFERLMGQASRTVSKPGAHSVDVARRMVARIHLAAATAAAPQPAAAAAAAAAAAPRPHPPLAGYCSAERLQTALPAPAGCGFTHAYTRASSGGALRHVFRFTADAAGDRAAAAVRAWRGGEANEGWEPFPGVLYNSGSTQRAAQARADAAAAAPDDAHAAADTRTSLLQLVRTKCMVPVVADPRRSSLRAADAMPAREAPAAHSSAHDVPAAAAAAADNVPWPRLRPDQQVEGRAPVSLASLQRALLAFYFKQFSEEIVAHYAARTAAQQRALAAHRRDPQRASAAAVLGANLLLLREEHEHFRGLARQLLGCADFLEDATAAIVELMRLSHARAAEEPPVKRTRQAHPAAAAAAAAASAAAADSAAAAADLPSAAGPPSESESAGADACRVQPWSTALAWYELHVSPAHACAHIDVFDKLLYCGEQISSDVASGTGVNSYVFALYEADEQEQRRSRARARRAPAAAAAAAAAAAPPAPPMQRWYGRVSYYVRHRFKQRHYCFAAMRWYDHASAAALHALWPSYSRVVHLSERDARAATPAHRLRAQQCEDSLRHWPVLNWAYRGETLDDLLPVHRIAGRWMPSLAHTNTGAHTLQVACPLRSRIHQ